MSGAIVKDADVLDVIQSFNGTEYTEEAFIERFKLMKGKEWNKVWIRYKEHEHKSKGKPHPMPHPDKYVMNAHKKVMNKERVQDKPVV